MEEKLGYEAREQRREERKKEGKRSARVHDVQWNGSGVIRARRILGAHRRIGGVNAGGSGANQ